MKWRDKTNKVDCGVFTMCHMKAYMGNGTKDFESGLQKQNTSQLEHLRVKYVAAILLDEINELREQNTKMIKK